MEPSIRSAAYLVAVLGSFLGLLSTGRARAARSRGRRNRWLIIAAFSIGGAAIWLMHFTAMLGFDVPQSPVRYSPLLTMAQPGLAVLAVGVGLMVVGHGRRSIAKIAARRACSPAAACWRCTSPVWPALHVSGTIHYRPAMVDRRRGHRGRRRHHRAVVRRLRQGLGADGRRRRGSWPLAVCGMHYTGMAAMSVELSTTVTTHGRAASARC